MKSTQADLDDANAFLANKELGPNKLKTAQTLENVEVNIAWRRYNEAALSAWLRDWSARYNEADDAALVR